MNLADYRESIELRDAGAPIPVGDSTFYIRRFGTPKSNELIKQLKMQLFGPLHKMQDGDDNQVFAHWLTDYGCTGWDNVIDIDDKPLQYSQQTARKLFTNPEYYMSLNQLLINAACFFENYLHETAESDAEALKKK
jgi:hypothetical protein